SRSATAMLVTAGCPAARRVRNVPMRPAPMIPRPISRVRADFAMDVMPGRSSRCGAKARAAARASGSPATDRSAKRLRLASCHPRPLPRLAAVVDERALARAVDLDLLRHAPRPFLQRDRLVVRRQAVVLRAVERCEALQPVERVLLLEDLCVDGHRHRRV